ncbi:CRISPR-associated protein Csm3 [Oceanicella actignis]|uniref:CRISPR system Cms endoribonuclease Csm3 n=2 Tax=Oceanicella actignis TaxID=1189325 RepID=A0A1M7S1W4_9RHOB|nr:CRISPR-associated protein, Csm3 family [Oceanicella actignis]SHN52420.1 CRISPR-associated protein Csm3 [Oceanicella actignis]
MSISQRTVDAYLGQGILTATLVVETGLHIGAGNDEIQIGGIDNPVVKTPQGDPYVPGSSIKGKLRFLMEWAFGKVRANGDGKVWGWTSDDVSPGDPILRIFGTAAKKEAWLEGPTRLLVRDAMLDGEWRERALSSGGELTEIKTEVTIDRIAGKALDGVGARQTERVPPGARFSFEAAFRVFSVGGDHGADDLKCLAWTIQGFDLLEQDALGGSGSRGYGRVRFADLALKGPASEEKLDNIRKGHAFGTDAPPSEILAAVRRAFGADEPAQ